MIRLAMITEVRFEKQTDQSDDDRERDQTAARTASGSRLTNPVVKYSMIGMEPVASPRSAVAAARFPEKSERPVIAKEDKEQTQNAQPITDRRELRLRTTGADHGTELGLPFAQTFIDGLDGQLDFELESARKHRHVLVKTAREQAQTGKKRSSGRKRKNRVEHGGENRHAPSVHRAENLGGFCALRMPVIMSTGSRRYCSDEERRLPPMLPSPSDHQNEIGIDRRQCARDRSCFGRDGVRSSLRRRPRAPRPPVASSEPLSITRI